jgi:thioredoxin reductase
MPAEVYEITIVGGGPAGLFGSFYAGLRDSKTKIIEATKLLGGALVHEYPNEVLRDVAGFVLITAEKLAERFIEQAAAYDHTICKGEKVTALTFDKAKSIWKITTDKDEHLSKTVVLATGNLQNLKKKHSLLLDSFKKIGLKVDELGIVVDAQMETNLPGLFACGDVISKPKEMNFITIASAEAAAAVNNAKKYCTPGASTFPGYSTDIRKGK